MIAAAAFDCCWLVHCDQADDFTAIVNIMASLMNGSVNMIVDCEGQILREYANHVTTGIGRKFFQSCMVNGRVLYHSGQLSSRSASALRALQFDPADDVYLAVAACEQAPFVTSEEKHTTGARPQEILDACGVRVLDTARLARALGL